VNITTIAKISMVDVKQNKAFMAVADEER